MTTLDLKSAVAQAEAATCSVKDRDLRKTAFEKVLEKLLGMSQQTGSLEERAQRRSGKTGASAKPKLRQGPLSYVEELIAAGFFKTPKQFKEIMEDLEARGHHLPRTTLSPTLLSLCRAKKLRRRKVDGGWKYSNW